MKEKITKEIQTCPRCGSEDTYWNDSQADPDNDSAYFLMMCDGCGEDYQAVFIPHHVIWEDD